MASQTMDDSRNAELRDETPAQRLDRNYGELLQELRVVQTGVQILFAFLLSLAFYDRFVDLSSAQRTLYFVTLLCAVAAVGFLIAPVAHHRLLFRQHHKAELVAVTNKLALVGMLLVLVALAASVGLIADVVLGRTAALIMAAGIVVLLATLWFAVPRLYRDPGA